MARNFTEPKITPHNPTSADMAKDWFVWFRFYDPSTDKWVMKSYKKGINNYKSYRERLAEANALRQFLKEELQAGWNPIRNEHAIKIYSLQQALDYVFNLKCRTIRPKTKETYRHIIKLFKEWLEKKGLLNLAIGAFTPSLAQQYMDQLIIEKNYSGRTHNDHLVILSTFFNSFMERDWIIKNPFRSVKKKQTTIGRNLAYTDIEKEKLKTILLAKDPWMYYFTQFLYFCFIRRTELTRLRVSDIDLANHTIIIRAEVSKNKTQESVVIPEGLEPILKVMKLEHFPSEFYVFGRHLYPSDLPYCNPDHISSRHNKFVKKLGIDSEKGLYSWKHTGVCQAYYSTGKDIYSLMRQLRHRELNTTSIYLKSLGLVQNDVFRKAMVA